MQTVDPYAASGTALPFPLGATDRPVGPPAGPRASITPESQGWFHPPEPEDRLLAAWYRPLDPLVGGHMPVIIQWPEWLVLNFQKPM